jgi:DNA-3-methyladenine glycosylase II
MATTVDEYTALGKLEPAFARAIEKYGVPHERVGIDASDASARYAALTRSIVSQQLSVAAARTIYGRLLELLGGTNTPKALLAQSDEDLRGAGMSGAKVKALRGIAFAVVDGAIDLDALDDIDESEAAAQLVALPGVGPWTADMFLMFVLGRPDVMAEGDVGVQNGIKMIFELEVRPTPKELARLAEPWSPHRTAACLLAWHVTSATPITADELES